MPAPKPRKVTILTYELRGLAPAGGIGTATTHLALALARLGHDVELLLGWQQADALDPHWAGVYAAAGIRVRTAPPSGERVDSWHFGVMRNIELALRADPPDVVIAQDFYAPAYSALRLRDGGLALESTLFVLLCHGTRGYILDTSRRLWVNDLPNLLSVGVLERAAVELADVVVSPSAYLLDWMRAQNWRLPEQAHVIPYFTRSSATGEPMTRRAPEDARVERLAFFGRLDEKKGIEVFAAGLNALEPAVLARIELEFVGKPTATWPPERVEGLLSTPTRNALRNLSFATNLDQHEALAHLKRRGTVAVMPSLLDNSPNTVYECLENGIPFLASNVGGIPELIAPGDRDRVLFEPTPAGIERALRRTLMTDEPLRPVGGAFDTDTLDARWADVLAREPPARAAAEAPAVDVVRPGEQSRGSAPFVLVLRDDDAPDAELATTLARVQAASDADVVTCAIRVARDDAPPTLHFFSGEPGGLAVLANDYGSVSLVRRTLLTDDAHDSAWAFLAGLAARGARIFSIPLPLVTCRDEPATIEQQPREALLVVQALERALPPAASSLARLAAGLAAATSARTRATRRASSRWPGRARSFARRAISGTPASPT